MTGFLRHGFLFFLLANFTASLAAQAGQPQSRARARVKKISQEGLKAPVRSISLNEEKIINASKNLVHSVKSNSKKTMFVDARRLKGNKFTETVRYILDHDDVRFKLQNITIEPEFVVPLLKALQESKVLKHFRDFSFVITNEKNAYLNGLNEQVFIGEVLPMIGHAEKLELNCLDVSDNVVREIAKKMPLLISLSFYGNGITDLTIGHLAAALPKLTKIHLMNSNITGKGVRELIEKFPELTALGLSGQKLTDDDFVVLTKAMPRLQSLSIAGQVFRNIHKIESILGIMQNLHTLDLSESNATNETVQAIIGTVGKTLRHLNISETSITGSGIKNIAQNLVLYTLQMDGLKNLGDDELELIAHHQSKLVKFTFAGVDFTNFGIMDIIHKLPNLVEISLIPATASKWIMTDCVASALVYNLPRLKCQHIQARRLPEEVRIYLARKRPLLYIEYHP